MSALPASRFPALSGPRRSVRPLLDPLDRIAESSTRFIGTSHGQFERDGVAYSLPRYLYVGPKGGGDVCQRHSEKQWFLTI